MLSYFTGSEEDSEDIVEKRVRVLRLHVETLTRQAEVREAELAAAKVKLKGFEAQQSEAAPREKKLFNRLEKLQAELKLAREHHAAEESRAADLAAHFTCTPSSFSSHCSPCQTRPTRPRVTR